MTLHLTRRRLIGSLGVGAGGLLLSGCDKVASSSTGQALLGLGEKATYSAQRLISDRAALAQEFSAADMSPVFRTNGNTQPASADYAAHAANNFADWRLAVDGLVANPMSLSLAQIRGLPRRTQITRHDCVEGWSAIGKWKGVPLGGLLDRAELLPAARYVVFRCADRLDADGPAYYESIDLDDAYHAQTILAYELNDAPLPVANGAPVRVRIERQLGYKMAKYVMAIDVVASFADIEGGNGGYWEDQGYEWYAGI